MDLSAVIFVVLALAWAGYLIPKALKHHDEMASDRLVEGHSDRVRILRRRSTAATPEVAAEVPVAEPDESRPAKRSRPPASAARRRRRVLALLLLAGAIVTGLAYLAYLPWWSTAIPAGLVVGFLVIARFSVRRSRRSSLAQRRPVENSVEERPAVEAGPEESLDLDLDGPETEPDVLADDGSLWDPLPLTLPTYVNKARARRTVRTIELTGMHSSGHDEADSALARESAAEPVSDDAAGAEQRRVAGA